MTEIITRPSGEITGAPVEMTETSWRPLTELTFEQWEDAGRQFLRLGRCWQWWVGDWISYGQTKYGETYTQAVELTGLEYKTVANAISVARKIEPSRRREHLPFSFHAEVADLEPALQDEWLERAERESYTRERLRADLKAVKAGRASAPPGGPTCEFVGEIHFVHDASDEQAALRALQAFADRLEKAGAVIRYKRTQPR